MDKYKKYLDAGDRFGRLVVLGVDESSEIRDGKNVRPSIWHYNCVCDCGGFANPTKNHLCTSHTTSCGCLHMENIIKSNRIKKHKVNRIEIIGDITKVFFFNNDGYAIIDTEDYNIIKKYCWTGYINGYVTARSMKTSRETIRMHRIILNMDNIEYIDHINGDPWDNRKSNLRPCNSSQNSMNMRICSSNTSGYTGVYFNKSANKWIASITANREKMHLGYFKNKQDAIDARQKAELKYFKEFAPSICRPEIKALYA